MHKSESISSLAKALAKAQNEVENATKGSVNPHFKSKYADLAEVLNTVRPVFSANGLSFLQSPSFSNGVVFVETTLLHESGEWISDICSTPIAKQDAQGIGSAITYLRRYSLAAFAGVAQEDDDVNLATKELSANEIYANLCLAHLNSIAAIKNGIANSELGLASEAWAELNEETKIGLWKAPTKGGCFTTQERDVMKSSEFREANIIKPEATI